MDINNEVATSVRGYLDQEELKQYANITITDEAEADDVISQAEEMIDSYVGFQTEFLRTEYVGKVTASTSTSITLRTQDQNIHENDYFTYCLLEIIGGTGITQRRRILSSTKAGVITVNAFDTTPDTTSVYKISQLSKFPRYTDVTYFTDSTPYQYYKTIPIAVKRAVAAQVKYIIEMGSAFFETDKSVIKAETFDDYQYEKKADAHGTLLIAPKAKEFLRGIVNRTGIIEV